MDNCLSCKKKIGFFGKSENKKGILRNGYVPPDGMTEYDELCQSCFDEIKNNQTRNKHRVTIPW